jgi:hypothetical protein
MRHIRAALDDVADARTSSTVARPSLLDGAAKFGSYDVPKRHR